MFVVKFGLRFCVIVMLVIGLVVNNVIWCGCVWIMWMRKVVVILVEGLVVGLFIGSVGMILGCGVLGCVCMVLFG